MKNYSGIGSRKTPQKYLRMFENLADELDKNDYVLRSGGAKGADESFKQNSSNFVIFRPYDYYLGNIRQLYEPELLEEADSILAGVLDSDHYTNIKKKSDYVYRLQLRNVFIILGEDLSTFSDFVICYSPGSGGTQTGIKVAEKYKIPVYNYYNRS